MTLPGKSIPIIVEPLRLPEPGRRAPAPAPASDPEPVAPVREAEPMPEPATP